MKTVAEIIDMVEAFAFEHLIGNDAHGMLADIERAIKEREARALVPLTDAQIDALFWHPEVTVTEGLRDFAREVERAHGITYKEQP